ncbi:hypothetical protein K438DRAFT_1884568, partial [Mycena galopus ATCC 62051]
MSSITCSPTPSFFDAPTAHADPPTQGDGHLVIDLSGDDSVHSAAASDKESMEEDVDDDTDAPYIPQPILPANLAYIFPNVLLLVLKLCHNDLLARNFSTLLSGTEKGGQYARRENTYMQLPDGKFVLRPHFRALYTERLINCAGLIATALNHERVGSRGFTPGAIRVSVPRSALDEAGLDNYPSLQVFLAAKWQLDKYRCDTAEQVMQQPDDFVEVFRYGVAVLGRIMVSTIENGEASVCNPGAGIGMSKAEFLECTGGRSLVARNILVAQPDRPWLSIHHCIQQRVRSLVRGADSVHFLERRSQWQCVDCAQRRTRSPPRLPHYLCSHHRRPVWPGFRRVWWCLARCL